MAALGYVYTLGKQTSCSPKRCTSQNATSAEFLEVQIPPRVPVYVSSAKTTQKFGGKKKKKNKYFELRNSWGCCSNSNYLLSSFASQDTTTCQNNSTTCKNDEHTQFHSCMGTQTHCAIIFLSLNPSLFRVVPNNLVSHARYTA